jgi:hypothetical protein
LNLAIETFDLAAAAEQSNDAATTESLWRICHSAAQVKVAEYNK